MSMVDGVNKVFVMRRLGNAISFTGYKNMRSLIEEHLRHDMLDDDKEPEQQIRWLESLPIKIAQSIYGIKCAWEIGGHRPPIGENALDPENPDPDSSEIQAIVASFLSHSKEPGLAGQVMYPKEVWKYEVANGDTELGYVEWTRHRYESDKKGQTNVKEGLPEKGREDQA